MILKKVAKLLAEPASTRFGLGKVFNKNTREQSLGATVHLSLRDCSYIPRAQVAKLDFQTLVSFLRGETRSCGKTPLDYTIAGKDLVALLLHIPCMTVEAAITTLKRAPS